MRGANADMKEKSHHLSVYFTRKQLKTNILNISLSLTSEFFDVKYWNAIQMKQIKRLSFSNGFRILYIFYFLFTIEDKI